MTDFLRGEVHTEVSKAEIRQRIKLFHNIDTYVYGEENERTVRKVISELRKEGLILIPVRPRYYTDIEFVRQDEIDAFVRSQIQSMRTQYFNTLRPIKRFIKNKELVKLMGGLDLLYEELTLDLNYEDHDKVSNTDDYQGVR
jgi:hypothetical protein